MPSTQSAAPAQVDFPTVPVVAVEPTAQADAAPGGLLQELERRQDAVLAQIDDLDAKLTALLGELGVTLTPDPEDA